MFRASDGFKGVLSCPEDRSGGVEVGRDGRSGVLALTRTARERSSFDAQVASSKDIICTPTRYSDPSWQITLTQQTVSVGTP